MQSSDLACISCHGALHSTTAELRCVDCGAAYPLVGAGLAWIAVPLAYRYVLPPLCPIYLWHDPKLGYLRHYDETAMVALARNAGLRHVETSYTGHAVKIVQLLLDRLLFLSAERRSSLWWKLERLDLRATRRPWGALQLNVVLARAI